MAGKEVIALVMDVSGPAVVVGAAMGAICNSFEGCSSWLDAVGRFKDDAADIWRNFVAALHQEG
jgi:hypothetical protein